MSAWRGEIQQLLAQFCATALIPVKVLVVLPNCFCTINANVHTVKKANKS